jgi:hypothetical protein
MPFMVGCTLWKQCEVRLLAAWLLRVLLLCFIKAGNSNNAPSDMPLSPPPRTLQAGTAAGAYCELPSLAGDICTEDMTAVRVQPKHCDLGTASACDHSRLSCAGLAPWLQQQLCAGLGALRASAATP